MQNNSSKGAPNLEDEMVGAEKCSDSEATTSRVARVPDAQSGLGALALDSLRLSQDFGAKLGVKKQFVTVPVRKPTRQEWFRAHPEWELHTPILELKEERETYLVEPSLWEEHSGELVPKLIVPTITRQGVVALWPLRLPGEDGRQDEWSRSAMVAAQMAKGQWVRLAANMPLGAYDISTSEVGHEPQWPEIGFDELVRIGFKDHFIGSADHPVLRRLRGET